MISAKDLDELTKLHAEVETSMLVFIETFQGNWKRKLEIRKIWKAIEKWRMVYYNILENIDPHGGADLMKTRRANLNHKLKYRDYSPTA